MYTAGWQLPYKVATYNTEITIFCLFTLINFPRLLLGSSGNKAEKLAHIIGMLALSGVAVMFHTYFITLQVFVYVLTSNSTCMKLLVANHARTFMQVED